MDLVAGIAGIPHLRQRRSRHGTIVGGIVALVRFRILFFSAHLPASNTQAEPTLNSAGLQQMVVVEIKYTCIITGFSIKDLNALIKKLQSAEAFRAKRLEPA
jgi:hypothetical protein